jgi:hypothetical protein
MSDFSPSREFSEFFFLAIDHGFGSIEGGGGPLVPFTMVVEASGRKQLTRFVTDRLEDGVEKAKSSITSSQSLSMYAIAWDGFITLEGRKWDAILVEAGEASQDFGVLFSQRYVVGKKRLFRPGRCERVGNPALIGRAHSRLRAVDA